jgi:N-acetylglucosaminyl-diphospho-decaprenol L-rhamnosyltransferase
MQPSGITVSVVSHNQIRLALEFIGDLRRLCAPDSKIVLTSNVPEDLDAVPAEITIVRNAARKGFGANHNAAFRLCTTPYFCVANPDIRLHTDPFPALLRALEEPGAGLAAPLVRSPRGTVEDSARRFPTIATLAAKALGRAPRLDYAIGRERLRPDWVAGMFMLLPAETYRQLGGFDERYFLYYEDVDLCARLRRAGHEVILEPAAEVVHHAQRASRRNPRHAWWHAQSVVRFLLSSSN